MLRLLYRLIHSLHSTVYLLVIRSNIILFLNMVYVITNIDACCETFALNTFSSVSHPDAGLFGTLHLPKLRLKAIIIALIDAI